MVIFHDFNLVSYIRKKINRIPVDIQYQYPESLGNNYTTILTDDVNFKNPVKPGGEFDFQKYSDAVVSIVNGSEPKFSIGVYGEWGSGKTTLMSMIQRKLTPEQFEWKDFSRDSKKTDSIKQYLRNSFQIKWISEKTFVDKFDDKKSVSLKDPDTPEGLTIELNDEKTRASLRINGRLVYEFLVRKNEANNIVLCENNILTVWFNAWRYENEKEFALIPLMKTIAYTIGEHPFYKELKPLILKALAIIGKDALRFYALKYFMTEKGLEEFENNLKNKFGDSEEFDRDALYFEGIKKIEQKMDEILTNQDFKNSRIVVFIDDLDRCSPEKTLEVFESIKVFLDMKGFIFILGLSREALDKLIVARLEKMGLKDISGEDYIRKIIQIEIQIGKWENTSIDELIKVISNELDDNYRNPVKDSKKLIRQVVESNPRQTKRFINNLIVALTANPKLNYNTFLCVQALQKRWNNFYQNLSDTTFLKEIKNGVTMTEEQRHRYVKKLNDQQKDGTLSYDLVDILNDLKICYIDKELWQFLGEFGDPLLKDIMPSQERVTDKEEEVAKTLETYKKARDSTDIPIKSEFVRNPNLELIYYEEVSNNANKYRRQLHEIRENLRFPPKDVEKIISLTTEMRYYFGMSRFSRSGELDRNFMNLKNLLEQLEIQLTSTEDKNYELKMENIFQSVDDQLRMIPETINYYKSFIEQDRRRYESPRSSGERRYESPRSSGENNKTSGFQE